jgi:drug/metabolite transporter (DMT)-like permease
MPAMGPTATDFGLLGLALIWGVNFSVMKVTLTELDPLALNALRFPLAAGALWIALRGRPGPPMPRGADLGRVVALGFVGNVVYQLCFVFGIDWTLAGNASLLLSTTPVWTMLLSAAVGHERPGGAVLLGILGTLVGMALVVLGRGDAVSLGSATLRGDLLMIGASVLWSTYTVGGRGPVARYGALRLTAWTLWVATPVIVLMGLPSLARTDLGAVSAGAWLGVAYAGLFSVGLAYLLWYRGVERLGNNRTAVYSNLVPVAALVTAWLWLGEVPTRLQVVGAAVILAGLTTARLSRSGAADQPGPSSLRWSSSGNS